MTQAGVNVPPALILPVEWCKHYKTDPTQVIALLKSQLPFVKEYFTAKFGYMPLLSVRSGARVSLPGMLDTILNVGLDLNTLSGWSAKLGKPCATDSYHRLVEMYGSIVNGLNRSAFVKKSLPLSLKYYEKQVGYPFPSADEQIICSILAVFQSWDNERAQVYRKMNSIPEEWGTAVVLQAMVFGNFNDNSCTGVMFSRNPDTGEAGVVGEYLVNAQGEDVVAGTATPLPLPKMLEDNPVLHAQLIALATKLETLNMDVQDIEFTVQDGTLYVLQTRNAKRSAVAAVAIALGLFNEAVITKEEAFSRVSVRTLDLANQKVLDPKFKAPPQYTGIPACSGVATGVVVFSSKAAVDFKGKCILVAKETTPDDIAGMAAAEGVLTMTGGATSHAAVVARGMNRVCIVGLGAGIESFVEGTVLSLDGATGRVWAGEVPVVGGGNSASVNEFKKLLRNTASNGTILEVGDEFSGAAYICLSELQTKSVELVKKILDTTAKQADTLIVDFNLRNAPGEIQFYDCFSAHFDDWLIQISAHLDSKKYLNVYVLNAPNVGKHTKVVAPASLGQLVTSSGLLLLEEWVGAEAAYEKVLAWRAKDNDPAKVVSIGLHTKHATQVYLSTAQAAHSLLGK